jgi:hypothetical protein
MAWRFITIHGLNLPDNPNFPTWLLIIITNNKNNKRQTNWYPIKIWFPVIQFPSNCIEILTIK